jgi:hypothetical protein
VKRTIALVRLEFLGAIAGCVLLTSAGSGLTQDTRVGRIEPASEVFESGLEADNTGSIYWVSDDEVLFLGPTGENRIREDGFRERIKRVTTWNVKTKEVKRYAIVSGGLCYDDGNISYYDVNYATHKHWSSHGQLDGVVTREEKFIRFDPITCLADDRVPPLPEWTKDRWIQRLRPEHGFLDLGPRREMKNTPVSLFRFGSDTALELPIKRREFVSTRPKFYPFKGAYFLESDYFAPDPRHPVGGINQGPWPRDVPRPVWWLFPDGKVEEIVIPPAVWMREQIVPTRTALIALSNVFFTVTGTVPYDGVYVIYGKDTEAVRALRGITGTTATSSDGCRLAVRRQPQPGKRHPGYWTLTVLDLCRGR